MKKYGKFFKKAALTAAICLGLSQSVWAMPTGGAVAEGTVSGFAANPASGAEFTVTGGPAIINWGAFGIAANERMSFNTAGGALLNQVTGGSMSQILGSLTQTGANPMFLVNPAGIVVGPGATINANQLVLSALAIKDQDFLSGNYNFAAASGTAGTLQILGKDTKINVSADTSEWTGFFGGWGKTVEVADGVTFTSEHSILDLEAGKKLVLPIHNGSVPSIVEAGGENKASFVGSSVIGSQSHAGKLKIGGGYVNLEDSTITLQSGSVTNDVFLSARSSSDSGNVQRATDNVVVLKNANISIDGDMSIKGGKVNIQGSTTLSSGQTESNPDSIDNGPATRLEILAAQSTENGRYLMTPENTITADGLTISKAQTVHVIGGKVDLSNSKINVANTYDKDDVEIRALPGMMYTTGVKTYPILAPASGEAKDYSVTLTNTNVTLETSGDTDPSIDIGGGVVTLDGATVTLTGGNDNGINIYAVSDVTGQESNETMTATAGNLVAIKGGSTLESKGQRLEIGAGAVSVTEGSTVSADKTFIVANTQLGFDQTTNFVVSKGTKGNITIGSKSTILPSTRVLDGKIVYVDDPDNPQPQPEPQPVVVNTNLPTGGKLASGGVTVNDAAWTAGDLENNSVVATKSNSIINWGTFNIEKGYGLTFNTDGGALLNRVTGGNLSSIYGTLTQRGDHPMFLVNPNGILVGKGATIDANQLVLSTLAISDATFQKDTLNDNCVLTTPTGRETPAAIQFKDGAKVSVDCFLKAFGGSVEADGVSITGKTDVKGNDADIHLLAANTVNGKIKLNSVQDMSAVADKNTISVSGSTVDSKGRVYLQGGNFAISDKSDIRGKGIYLRSAEQYISGGSQTSASQDSANTTVTIKDSKIRATKDADGVDGSIGHSFIVGGKVSIEDSEIHSIENYRGFKGWTYGENDHPTYSTGLANTVSVKNSELLSKRYVRLQGGQVSVDGGEIRSPRVQLWAESSYTGPGNSMQHIDGSGVTHLTRESGNQVTFTNSHAGSVGEFNVLGWNADVTGSQVNAANVDITAVNGWKRSSSDGVRTDDYTADGTNAVAISDSKLTSTEGNVRVVAGGVSVDKSELDAARYAQLWIAKGLHLSTEGERSVKSYEADTDNAIAIANSTIHSGEGSRSSILGGKLDIKDNSTVTGTEVTLQALKSYALNGSSDNEDSGQSMTATADKNTVTISDSKVDAQGRVSLQGGDFNISGSDIRGKEVYLRSAENYLKGSSQDSANTAVTIKDSVIHARKDMDAVDGSVGNSFIVGGKVSIEDSEIHSIENYRGFKGWTYGENDYPTYSTGLANTVSVKNSELLSKRYVRLQGGQVSVDGGEIRSPRVQLWAESSYTGPGNSMHHIDGSGVTHLTRESGNQVTFTNSHAGSVGEFNVLGWNANITGSQVNAANVDITAVNGWKRSSSDGVRTDDYTADGTNAVAISDSKLTSTEGNVHVVAGSVSVDKSELDAARYAQLWIAKGLHLSTEGERSVKSYEADTDNAISIANSTIHSGEGSRSSILSGKLDIKDNSTVTGTEVTLRASKSYILDGASDNEDATLTLKDSKVDADKKLFAISGKVDVDGSELHAKEQLQIIASETNPVYKAGKANTMKIRNGSTLASEGDVTVFGGDVTMSGKSTASAGENLFFAGGTEMTMKNNVPTLTGVKETTRVSKDSTLLQGGVDVTDQFATTRAIVPETIPEEVADSYIEGMDKMAEVLEPNTTPAERQNATQKVVQEINNNSGSNLEKAAAVSGMMQAILLDDNISDSEKVALQKEIIQTFEPTKQVISEANNTVTSATQQASDAQPQQTQQQSAAVNTNAATAIPTAAEVNESPVNMGSTEE